MMPSQTAPEALKGWRSPGSICLKLLKGSSPSQPVPAWWATQSCLLPARACGEPVGHLQEAEKRTRDLSTPWVPGLVLMGLHGLHHLIPKMAL